jgi:hypothetical protein
MFTHKMCSHLTPLNPIISIGRFTKLGIDFMTCNPTLANGHDYIIVAIDYFTKWVMALITFSNDGTISTLFVFNHIIVLFGVPTTIVTNHGSHFHNKMMIGLAIRSGFSHVKSTPMLDRHFG